MSLSTSLTRKFIIMNNICFAFTSSIYFLLPFLLLLCSGLDETHPLFEGRAIRGVDFVGFNPPSNGDPNGHGTHVAGAYVLWSP